MNEEFKNGLPENGIDPPKDSEPTSAEQIADADAHVTEAASEEPAAEIQEEPAAEIQEEPAAKAQEEPAPFVYPENPIYTQQRYTGAPVNQQYATRPAAEPIYAPAPKPKKKRTGLKVFLIIIALLLVFAFGVLTTVLIGSVFGDNFNNTVEPSTSAHENYATDNEGAPDLQITDTPVTPSNSDGTLTPAQIAEKVKPSIVGIVVYSKYNSSVSAGEGTGVIMSTDSSGKYTYIVTCAHVISGSGINITVQTEDGTSYDAVIVGIDTRTDLGVVRIEASGLTPAEFGNSDALSVGDSVYAIGNPGGVEFFGSFTGGFVSAIDRPVSSEIGYTMTCIQHDAAINPGNSGGALVNSYGQVIGINSQKIAATDYEGMGFAIPISDAKEIIDSLIRYNYVPNRPKLGITYYPVAASDKYNMIARVHGLPAGTLIIDSISEDSSLADTDVRQYDMITAVDGEELTTADVLLEKIDSGSVGDKFTLSICRVNSDYTIKEFDVDITLIEDKGDAVQEEEPVEDYVDPFEFYGY